MWHGLEIVGNGSFDGTALVFVVSRSCKRRANPICVHSVLFVETTSALVLTENMKSIESNRFNRRKNKNRHRKIVECEYSTGRLPVILYSYSYRMRLYQCRDESGSPTPTAP